MKVVRILAGLAVAVALVSTPSCGGPVTTKGPAVEAGLPVSLAAAADKGYERLWQTDFLLAPNTTLAKMWLCGKYIVGCGSDNRIYCANAKTGVTIWAYKAAEDFQTVWQPAVDKDTLWVATTMRLLAFEAATGRQLASTDLDFAPAARPLTNGVHCFIPDAKGWLQAVALLPKVVSWGRVMHDSITAAPAMDSTFIYFAGQNGIVYASHQNARHIVWEYKTEGAIVADLKRTAKGLVLAGSLDYMLYAFQGSSGRVIWRYNAGEPVRMAPYTVDKQVFVFTKAAGLATLAAANGRVQWTLADGADLVSADPKVVYPRPQGHACGGRPGRRKSEVFPDAGARRGGSDQRDRQRRGLPGVAVRQGRRARPQGPRGRNEIRAGGRHGGQAGCQEAAVHAGGSACGAGRAGRA